MAELFLSFKDKESRDRRLKVETDRFTIGRQPDNDLSFSDSRLSRHHLLIERFAEVYVASDLGSSNGSTINGGEIGDPVALSDGDVIDLGGGLELNIELPSEDGASDVTEKEDEDAGAGGATPAGSPPSGGSGKGSLFDNILILGPLLGIGMLLLVIVGAVIVGMVGGSGSSSTRKTEPDLDFPLDSDDDGLSGSSTLDPVQVTTPQGNGPVSTPSTPVVELPPTPAPVSDETEIARRNVVGFLRKIAQRDPNPVITSGPLTEIKAKISQVKAAPSLVANIEDARRGGTQISSLAMSKNLKPQFLLAATLSKLGNRRANVLSEAGKMIDVLAKLKIQIGDGFANESIVIIAAYEQGERGQFLAMRDTMTKLANQNPTTSSRKVRTLWFLREKGKINGGQYDLALRFLAVGAVLQNPRAFGVNAEPLVLN